MEQIHITCLEQMSCQKLFTSLGKISYLFIAYNKWEIIWLMTGHSLKKNIAIIEYISAFHIIRHESFTFLPPTADLNKVNKMWKSQPISRERLENSSVSYLPHTYRNVKFMTGMRFIADTSCLGWNSKMGWIIAPCLVSLDFTKH